MARKRKLMKVGDHIVTEYGRDDRGKWFWRNRAAPFKLYGPFDTKDEADEHIRVTIFGPQCTVETKQMQ